MTPACPLHDAMEEERGWMVLVYRCSRCLGCYLCQHRVDLDGRRWRCCDGVWRPVVFDPGVRVRQAAA
jgi:hypothetical protein